MEIVNTTPFEVKTLIWEDQTGRLKLTVVIKMTFNIASGKAILSDKQVPIFISDEYYAENPSSSVKFEADTALFKPRADVVVVGRAIAPLSRAATVLDVTLRVGELRKTLRVFGNRKWEYSGMLSLQPTMTPPEPFRAIALVYENAYGGIDASSSQYCKENIFGKGFIGKKSRKGINEKQLPNIEDPRGLIGSWRSRPFPAGFGFYGRGCLPRLKYASKYDDKDRSASWLPYDFDFRVFNGAHPDLQTAFLRGDEAVELIHMADDPLIRFNLPAIQPDVTIEKSFQSSDLDLKTAAGGATAIKGTDPSVVEEKVDTVCDTLVMVPEEKYFYQVFRGVYRIERAEEIEMSKILVTANQGA